MEGAGSAELCLVQLCQDLLELPDSSHPQEASPKTLFCISSSFLTIAHSQTESSMLVLMDVCSLQSCPDLLAKGLSAPARAAGNNASCG